MSGREAATLLAQGATPRLSIIVPSYNQARYLPATLASVRALGDTGWECIIVDDGSTDDSVAIATAQAEADSRFRLIQQANAGVSAARNRGMENARGEFVSFLDSDDLVTSGLTGALLPLLEKEAGLDVVYGRHRLIDEHGVPTGFESTFQPNVRDYAVTLIIRNLFALNAAVVRRAFLVAHGLCFSPTRRPEDWAFWIELAIAGAKFRAVDTLISEYRVHPQARTREIVERARRAEAMLAEMVAMAGTARPLPRSLLPLARLCMYCRRYADAAKFDDDEARAYCLAQLRDIVHSPALVGLSRHHLFALGQLLNVSEQSAAFPWLLPFVGLRRMKRRLHGSAATKVRRRTRADP